MLFRFSLYGFLKNQRYFEPFLFLFFLDRGLGFAQIGLLIAFRELVTLLLEIPSGAFADVVGRRRSMVLSFAAYLVSFGAFALSTSVLWMLVAMAFFSVGDSFRTGTHKAMIFAWLEQQGRLEERTKVYGFTRSWSKLGSAVGVVIGAVIVLATGNYTWLFLAAAVPYTVDLVNLATYPPSLEREATERRSIAEVWRATRRAVSDSLLHPRVRRKLAESAGFEGVFTATKDYLQPLLLALVTLWWSGRSASAPADGDDAVRVALLIGPVYLVLFLISAWSSRQAHRVVDRCGSAERAAQGLWLAALGCYLVLSVSIGLGGSVVAVFAFVVLHALQNVWRPILVSSLDDLSDSKLGATMLSVESQVRRLGIMVLAPLVGWLVDLAAGLPAGQELWPVGAVGVVVATGFVLVRRLSEVQSGDD